MGLRAKYTVPHYRPESEEEAREPQSVDVSPHGLGCVAAREGGSYDFIFVR